VAPPARWINHFTIHHIVKLTQTRNEEGEKVGAFNKAFGGVYKLRTLAKRVKAWNKKVYGDRVYQLNTPSPRNTTYFFLSRAILGQ